MNTEDHQNDLTIHTENSEQETCQTQSTQDQDELCFHPLARRSQPRDWCQILQDTN